MIVNLTDWHTRNCWIHPSGEFGTRPGLRLVSSIYSLGTVVAAFSVPNYGMDEYHHYLIYTNSHGNLNYRMYDDDFTIVAQRELGINTVPRGVTWGTTLNELVITSPDMPMLWGVVGGPLRVAGSEPSDNESNTPAIDIPRGICVSWASRIVIANGTNIYISDPVDILGGSPRTFTGVNQQWRPGEVYALHVDAGGNLIACTSNGTWRLPADAAAAGQEAIGEWRLISTHQTVGYDTTAMHNGRIYGLSLRGYRLIDVEGAPEIPLNDPIMPLSVPRIARNDWRNARMVEGELGPIIVSREHEHYLMVDVDRKFSSWWQFKDASFASNENVPIGTWKQYGGGEWIVTDRGVWAPHGNHNGASVYTTVYEETEALVYGRIPINPNESPTWRHIEIGSTSKDAMQVRFRSGTAIAEATNEELTAPVEGVATWAEANAWGNRRFRSHRFDLDNDESRDPAFEFKIEGSLERIMPTAYFRVDGLEKRRPT